MKLVVVLKLQPSSEQARALELTLRTANLAANAISTLAWQAQVFGQYAIHKLTYRRTRGLITTHPRRATGHPRW